MKTKGYFFGCLSSITYGLIPLFALPLLHEGLRYDSILFYRFFVAAIMLGVILFLKKENLKITKKEITPLIVLGLLFALSAQFLFWSYDYLSVGVASTLLFLYPIFVAILMNVLFKEKVSLFSQIAIFIALAGIVILSQGTGASSINFVGISLILCSALSYALYIIVVNKSSVQKMSAYKLTFYALLFSSIFFLIKSTFIGGLQPLHGVTDFFRIAMLSLLPTIVSCVAMVYAVRYVGSTSTAVLGALEPVTAVAIGVFVFQEEFTLNLATGVMLILTAVSMIILSDKISPKINMHRKRRV